MILSFTDMIFVSLRIEINLRTTSNLTSENTMLEKVADNKIICVLVMISPCKIGSEPSTCSRRSEEKKTWAQT